MPSSLEKLSTNRVKLTIEMPFDELKPSLDKAYKDIAMSVDLHHAVHDEHCDRQQEAKVESPEKRRRHGGEKERKLAPLGAR